MFFRMTVDSSHGPLGQDGAPLQMARLLNLAALHVTQGKPAAVCQTPDGVTVGSWTTQRHYAHATRQVAEWIVSDGEHYRSAREHAEARDYAFLAMHLLGIILAAAPGSAVYGVKEALTQEDLAGVNWATVAADLVGD